MKTELLAMRKQQTVLLLEKSSMLFDAIRSFLVHAGFEKIIHCNSYNDAIQSFKSHPVSLIITDAEENNSAANDLLHFVRIVKKQATLPFIVISGASEVEAVRKILAFGYTEYLVKPFNEHLFHEKLDIALGNKKASAVADEERKFQSKLLMLCENELFDSIGTHPDSFSSKYQVVRCHTFKQTIKSIQKDNEIDIIILDESFAQSNPDAMKQFLSLNTMGQVEVIILLNDMSEEHVNNVHSLGIHYLIEKRHADLYLQQLVPLIINKKRNLTYTNRMVRSLRDKDVQQSNLQDSVFHQIIDSSQQITDNCTQISHNPKTPPTVTQLADESKYNAECISFWAGAVEYPKVSPGKSFKEDISLEKCIENARYLLKTLLTTRHLTIASTIKSDANITNNPILFNSLFMFLIQAMLKEVVYESACEVSFEQQQGSLCISGKIQHIPRLSSVAISTQLIDPDMVKVQWSEPIQRLINGCGFEVQMHYFLKDDKAVLSINCG